MVETNFQKEKYIEPISVVHQQLIGLAGLGISIATFFGIPPWLSKGEPDLDMVLAFSESVITERQALTEFLEHLHENTKDLPYDIWYCSVVELARRMRRIPFKQQPRIFNSVTEWDSFGFTPALGREQLSVIVLDSFNHQETGGPIHEDPDQKIMIPRSIDLGIIEV